MSIRVGRIIALAIIAFGFMPQEARAGGWAVITLDEVPLKGAVGNPIKVGFRVLQHGGTGMSDLSPVIQANRTGSVEVIEWIAKERGEPGHYEISLLFTEPGEWQWSINAFNLRQPMPAIQVAVGSADQSANPSWVVWIVGSGIIVLGLAGFFPGRRTSPGMLIPLGGILLVLLLVIGTGFASDRVEESAVASFGETAAGSNDPGGAAVFIAKGCATCHYHAEIGHASLQMGPDLTGNSLPDSYLTVWLEDPRGIKPNTTMPNLDLTESDIRALISFLAPE